jgi:hypothetical protein
VAPEEVGGGERGMRHGRRAAEAGVAATGTCRRRVGGGGAGVVGSTPSGVAMPHGHWSSEFICLRGLSVLR